MVRIVKKSAERRLDIVKAAGYLFETKEYEKTTMQDVMQTLGIAKGTIYHYFKSKEALLEAVIEDMVAMNIQKMQALMEETQGTALERIQVLVEKGNLFVHNRDVLDDLKRKGNDALHIRLLVATIVKEAPLYAQLIVQGCQEGIFHTDTPLECAELMLSAIHFLTDMRIAFWPKKDLIRRMHAFPKFIEQQLKAKPGSFHFILDQLKELEGMRT